MKSIGFERINFGQGNNGVRRLGGTLPLGLSGPLKPVEGFGVRLH